MDAYDASTYGDSFADVYDDWYADVSDVDATVARISALAGNGPILELGVGTGRLAIPLAARGHEVHGLDASAAMLERLRAKPGGDAVHVHAGDMAELGGAQWASTRFAVVLAAFNTLFNLTTEAAQLACLRGVAGVLAPDGRLVVECFVPAADAAGATRVDVAPVRVTDSEVVVRASRSEAGSRVVRGRHVHVTADDVHVRQWAIRWLTPDELDSLALSAGMTLERRDGGWSGEQFDTYSEMHVSTYQLCAPTADRAGIDVARSR